MTRDSWSALSDIDFKGHFFLVVYGVCVCVFRHTLTWTCVWRPDVDAGCLFLLFSTLFFETCLSLTLELTFFFFLVWLISWDYRLVPP